MFLVKYFRLSYFFTQGGADVVKMKLCF